MTDYDQYWRSQNWDRRSARSRERARVTMTLLGKPQARRLLEVGCGPGWALEAFRNAGYQVSGIDVSAVAVEEAQRRALQVQLLDIESESLHHVSFERDNMNQNRPDAVVALEVLEHLLDPLAALEKMKDVLAPGGNLVVSLPNELALPARIQMLAGRLPFGGHRDPHVRHFDRRRSRELFDAAGLEIVEEAALSILPPRWGLARIVLAPFVRLAPGCFSLATLYLLRISQGGSSER